jgi:hypothetical protein
MITNKVYVFDYIIDENKRKEMYDTLVKQHQTNVYLKESNNMGVNHPFMTELNEVFIQKCRDIYGPFEEQSLKQKDHPWVHDSRYEAWVYLNNKDWYKGENIHNHMPTSTYVGVYYLNVPKHSNLMNGCLKFYDYKWHLIDYFYPKQGQFIIFESDLFHSITKNNCEEYRISINLEILVKRKLKFVEQ